MRTFSPHPWTNFRSAKEDIAFTLIELLVVLGAVGLLLLTVLPVLAGPREKATRVQCAANLRQLHVASMLYANQYAGWLPLWRAGLSGQNNLSATHYSRYAFSGQANYNVPRSPNPPGGTFQNAGYLYGENLIDDGRILYCPGLVDGAFSASFYSPLLTSDSGGTVRSSYLYNPRTVNPTSSSNRRYQKTTDLEPHKLFMVDVIQGISFFSHLEERGWNVLFTDGSVAFSRNQLAYVFVANGNYADPVYMDLIFNWLEQDR